jgi:hypothetical protein
VFGYIWYCEEFNIFGVIMKSIHMVFALVGLVLVPYGECAEEFKGCRMVPNQDVQQCSLPYNLGNFQGYYECDASVQVGRPSTMEDVREMVLCFDRVKAVGVGHSWWQEQFCSGSDENAVNLVMTELKNTLEFIENPVNPRKFNGEQPPEDFPIHVDEDAQEVTVTAGIPQRALLEYLSEYTYGKEPNGWTLPAFSYFIDQTIGGAVATGSHGSSFQHGSLSSQLSSLRLMLANGTILDISAESNPHLFKAAGVSIGRLGVITDLTFRIVPENIVTRSLQEMSLLEFAEQVKEVQDAYNDALLSADMELAMKSLNVLDKTQALWHPIEDEVWRLDFTSVPAQNRTKASTNDALYSYNASSPVIESTLSSSLMSGDRLECSALYNTAVFAQEENPNKVEPNELILENWRAWGRLYPTVMKGVVVPGDFEASKSYITMSEQQNEAQANGDPYNQFEVSVPMNIAGDCLLGLNTLVYTRNLSTGFRAPALIRFVSEEEFYLSPSNGHPVMYINIEDHLSISSGVQNKEFDEVLDYFLDQCDARLHWGKAGWPTHQPCFDGAEDYPESWCDFGCAVQELDPEGKFRSESDVWRWSASRAGSAVEFSSCCSSSGFLKSECVCERTPIC